MLPLPQPGSMFGSRYRIEAMLGGVCVLRAPRALRGTPVIDFRHVLPALKRKPGALVRWRMRDALFPRSEYRDTWRRLIERLPEARAARTMVGASLSVPVPTALAEQGAAN